MFVNRPTKKSINARIDKVDEVIKTLAATNEVQIMLQFEYLPLEKRMEIKAAWDEHYIKAKDSNEAQMFRTIGQAYKAGDIKTVKMLSAEAHQKLETVTFDTPSYADPDTFHTGKCGEYKFLLKRKEDLLKELASFGDRGSLKNDVKDSLFT